ncbi:STB3 (YDR169C) [Zygosaccharomyces parabailii]|nr:STB3 (YDR169C) [Zygosaccharomyces parabailii]
MPEVKKEHSPKMGFPKPISTSSPAGLAAAQMVTPSKLSSLLLEKGPLAIRHITQTLGAEIPSFKDLSSSKQRRLIMSAMESGDQQRSVVFEKIGWGQWSAKLVTPESFAQEREATNVANAKVKDIVSQESQRRRSSSSHGTRKPQLHSKKSSVLAAPAVTAPSPPPDHPQPAGDVLYIDENALASDDDDDENLEDRDGQFLRSNLKKEEVGEDDEEDEDEDDEEEDDENDGPYSFRRRKSSVVWAEHQEDVEHELLARRVRPFLKNRSRRSSSKLRTSVSKPTSSLHLDLPQPQQGQQAQQHSLPLSRHNSNHKIDLEQLTNSISEPTSRRESRVSFSKESSIRSTLFPHKSYLWSSNSTRPQEQKRKAGHRKTRLGTGEHYSDTDEEDWATIGAASLRNNSVPPRIDTVANSPNGFVAPPVGSDTATIPSIDEQMSPKQERNSQEQQEQPRRTGQRSTDDNNAAFLLMSLKS